MKRRLYTTAYREKRRHRLDEYEICLAANCDSFDEVRVLAEDVQACLWPSCLRARWSSQPARQKFADLFRLIRETAAPEDLVVVANGDLMVNGYALDQMSEHISAEEAWCLTRWDVHPTVKLYDHDYSQDAWIFLGPPGEAIVGDYDMGGARPGCDNKLAHDLRHCGYVVKNPSRDVRTYHLHVGDDPARVAKFAKNRLPTPYLFVRPHRLGERPVYRTRP